MPEQGERSEINEGDIIAYPHGNIRIVSVPEEGAIFDEFSDNATIDEVKEALDAREEAR